jgi:hypothetical protein
MVVPLVRTNPERERADIFGRKHRGFRRLLVEMLEGSL